MKTRTLGPWKVYPVGLGVMAVDEYGHTPLKEAIELFQYAMEQGVTLFDTADVYGNGHNEELLGKAFSAKEQDKILITTKAGCTRPGGVDWGLDGRPEHIKEAIKASLKRLGLKRIKLYQLHSPDPNVPFEDTVRAFKELHGKGLFEQFGLSNVSLEQLKIAQKIIPVVSVQNQFRVQYKKDEAELLPYLTKHNIAFLPYFPLGGNFNGVASPKLRQEPKLQEIAKKLKISVSQLCLAWILNKWPTAIPIPGTTSKEHLLENIQAAKIELPKEVIKKMDEMY
ncbi:MAG: aldo/keto reductase [Nanoarchaeota archaeon]